MRPGCGVGLRASPDDVDRACVRLHRGGCEPLVGSDLAADRLGERQRIAVGDHVQLPLSAEQRVANGSADHPGLDPAALDRVAQPIEAGQADDPSLEPVPVYLAVARHLGCGLRAFPYHDGLRG